MIMLKNIRQQEGYLILESLITIGILAVGLLGVSAMQLTSMKSSYSAVQRGEAAILVAAMSDRMRANPLAFANRTTANIDYNLPGSPSSSRAVDDFAEWQADIDTTFGETSSGSPVAAGSVTCITSVNCILQIQWNDPRADAALNPSGEEHSPTGPYRYKHIVSVIF